MSVLPDHWIEHMARKHRMIEPYAENRIRRGKISYGLSSYGYDFRLSDEYKIPELKGLKYLDPKKMGGVRFREVRSGTCLVPANSFILGRSLEYFRIPRHTLVMCTGKSTYSRCGIVVNVTPFEPEWEGFATIAVLNSSPIPVRIYSGEGIAQLVFLRSDSDCRISYADRKGKYQAQRQIQISRV